MNLEAIKNLESIKIKTLEDFIDICTFGAIETIMEIPIKIVRL